ncbi:DinB family protein [Gemmatimonadota bacterium DH-20]|uniref:DinB family protein n=2 Tax=Gaopeijia maritima TaxID=3119007 RepID=A0ABU9EBB6_9BACT
MVDRANQADTLMPDYINQLRSLVLECEPRLSEMDRSAVRIRPAPGKWCPAEILGHLIDSASNNHDRFVRAQSQESLVFPGYDQVRWVEVQRYAEAPWDDLVAAWSAINRHLAWVMAAVPEAVRERPRADHNLDSIAWKTVPSDEPSSLGYFMADYVGHLEHHLKQILGPNLGR